MAAAVVTLQISEHGKRKNKRKFSLADKPLLVEAIKQRANVEICLIDLLFVSANSMPHICLRAPWREVAATTVSQGHKGEAPDCCRLISGY